MPSSSSSSRLHCILCSVSMPLLLADSFLGRDAEVQKLRAARLAANEDSSQIVIVSGEAGVGKTALVQHALPQHSYVQATPHAEPYTVVRALLDSLEGLPPIDDETIASADFMAVVRDVIRRNEEPVVWFVDDLQWADPASLRWLVRLFTTVTTNLVWVGAHCGENAIWRESLKVQQLPFEEIVLGNWTLETVQEWVRSQVRCDDTEELAQVLMEKTGGNVFYTIASLQLLESQNLLKYSFGSNGWSWDIDQIREHLSISENVVDMVLERFAVLPEELKDVLSVASFLRITVDVDLLSELLQALDKAPTEKLERLLDVAVEDGLLQKTSAPTVEYSFVHDRVQEAATLLLDDEGRHPLMLQIGEFLLKRSSTEAVVDATRDWVIFAGLETLNSIPRELCLQHMDVEAMLIGEMAGGRIALQRGAHETAAKLLLVAIDLLHELGNPWVDRYDVCLTAHELCIEALVVRGQFERGQRLADEALKHAKKDYDKLTVYKLLGEALGRQRRHPEAINVQLRALKILGERPSSSNPFGIMLEFKRLKRDISQLTDEELSANPDITDPKLLMTLEILCDLLVRAVWNHQTILCCHCIIRVVRLTLIHGNSAPGNFGLMSFAVLSVAKLGWQEFGHRIGSLAVQSLPRYPMKRFRGHIFHAFGKYVLPAMRVSSVARLSHSVVSATLGLGLNRSWRYQRVLIEAISKVWKPETWRWHVSALHRRMSTLFSPVFPWIC